MACVRLCILICVVAAALVENVFVDAIRRKKCKTAGCTKTVRNFEDTFRTVQLLGSNVCDNFYDFSCGAYYDKLIYPKNVASEQSPVGQLKNVPFGHVDRYSCAWDQCAAHPEDIIAGSYEHSCNNRHESPEDNLKHFVDILNEASEIEKWTDLENWLVNRGLESSFFKTYRVDQKKRRYVELTVNDGPGRPFVLRPVDVKPDSVMIDLRPNATAFSPSDEDRVKRYIDLLKEAKLSKELAANLLAGYRLSRNMDDSLDRWIHPKSGGIHILHQRYTRNISDGSRAVHWQHLWECNFRDYGYGSNERPHGYNCRISTPQKFNWSSYFLDHYWGSVAVSNDEVPLLEHDIPKHWVVEPVLIVYTTQIIQKYSNQLMKNLILWRMAWQLTRHADDSTKSILRLNDSPNDPHSNCTDTFSDTLTQVRTSYNWYERFPEQTRKQYYTVWRDVNFQMKYLLYKRFHEVETLNSMEYYPRFPYASTFVEPRFPVKVNKTPTNLTTLDLALNFQKVERTLLLRIPRLSYNQTDIDDILETLEGVHERFIEDRPASLNFGALGSAIGYNILKRFIRLHDDHLPWLDNYKVCVEKNFPGFIGKNNTKLRELASIMFGVEAAWHAYEQHAAMYGDKNLKMPRGKSGEKSSRDVTGYDQKQLFFASFGNSLCGGKQSERLINVAVQMLPQFREAFECKTNLGGAEWIACQYD